MRRDVVWERAGPMGLEHLALDVGEDTVRADGILVLDLGGDVVRVRYAIDLDREWRTRAARLALDRGGSVERRTLARTGDAWSVDGMPRADLAGAFDIDIAGTPFTNTMPLRRLALALGVPQTIRVAYVGLPRLEVAPAEQEYTRLGTATVRYRGLGSGFETAIAVDADGLVVDYPPIWRQR